MHTTITTSWLCLLINIARAMPFLIDDNQNNDFMNDIFIVGPETNHVNMAIDKYLTIMLNDTHQSGWFTAGITLKDASGWFSTTNSHNVCRNPHRLSAFNKSSTVYNQSSNSECARFYWKNQTKAAGLHYRSGADSAHTVDFSGYRVYVNPPKGYKVEKKGAATGHTTGSIHSIEYKNDQFLRSCNKTYRYGHVYYIESQLMNRTFSSKGDCGSIVFNGKDKFIIGVTVGSIQRAGKRFSVAIPFTSCYDGYFVPYHDNRINSSVNRTPIIIIVVLSCVLCMMIVLFLFKEQLKKRYHKCTKRKCSERQAFIGDANAGYTAPAPSTIKENKFGVLF